MVDESLSLRIAGLHPQGLYEIVVEMLDDLGRTWPAHIVMQGISMLNHTSQSSWSYQGVLLPFLPYPDDHAARASFDNPDCEISLPVHSKVQKRLNNLGFQSNE